LTADNKVIKIPPLKLSEIPLSVSSSFSSFSSSSSSFALGKSKDSNNSNNINTQGGSNEGLAQKSPSSSLASSPLSFYSFYPVYSTPQPAQQVKKVTYSTSRKRILTPKDHSSKKLERLNDDDKKADKENSLSLLNIKNYVRLIRYNKGSVNTGSNSGKELLSSSRGFETSFHSSDYHYPASVGAVVSIQEKAELSGVRVGGVVVVVVCVWGGWLWCLC
jgi:hypothetical protein